MQIGLAIFSSSPGRGTFTHWHLLISEHLGLRNGKYVEDNRDKFLFGDSEVRATASCSMPLSLRCVCVCVCHCVWRHRDHPSHSLTHSLTRTHTHCHSLSLVLVVTMKSKNIKTKISHAYSLTLSLCHGVCVSLLAMQQASLRSLADRYGLHPAALHNAHHIMHYKKCALPLTT